MRSAAHRTPEMKAARVAKTYIHTHRHLELLLMQFSRAHRLGILERLTPHLTFAPDPERLNGLLGQGETPTE